LITPVTGCFQVNNRAAFFALSLSLSLSSHTFLCWKKSLDSCGSALLAAVREVWLPF
jgi:hypothetical protein